MHVQTSTPSFSEIKQHATIIELTVPFESNFKKAHNRKQAKYHDLLDDIKGNGFDIDLTTIEVGSRGFICPDGFDQLKDMLLISGRQMEKLLVKVSVAAITGSFKICTSRNHHPD